MVLAVSRVHHPRHDRVRNRMAHGIGETRPEATLAPIEKRPFSRQLFALMSIVFATGASTAMVWPLLMIFLQDNLHADVGALAWAYLPAAMISSFLPSRLGRIADRWGRKLPMIGGLIVGALASALIPHLGSLVALAILWAVESASYAASSPAERAFVADIAGRGCAREQLRAVHVRVFSRRCGRTARGRMAVRQHESRDAVLPQHRRPAHRRGARGDSAARDAGRED